MNGRWYSRLHHSIRHNRKTTIISDYTFRRYIYLLTLQGEGNIPLFTNISEENGDYREFLRYLRRELCCTKKGLAKVHRELGERDLLEDKTQWRVKNYLDRQYKNAKDSLRKVPVEKSMENSKEESRGSIVEKRKIHKKVGVKKKPAKNEEVEHGCRVLCEVGNKALGTDRGPTGPMRSTVKAILKAGFTAEDIRTVAEHRVNEEWFTTSSVLESLIRIGKFESFLQVAKESGQAKAIKIFTREELGL